MGISAGLPSRMLGVVAFQTRLTLKSFTGVAGLGSTGLSSLIKACVQEAWM